MYDAGSEDGPPGNFEIYRAEGESLFKNRDYKKAIESFTIALDKRGERDIRDVLVARSRCYLMLNDIDQALKDAEESLSESNKYHKGLFQKAECLYSKGEFETALMFYYRGHKLRPQLREFSLGISKCQEAIDNAVGSPETVKLTTEGDLTYFEEQRGDQGLKNARGRKRPQTRQKKTQERPKKLGSDKTVKQLLGELYEDRAFLEELLDKIEKDETDTGKKIYSLVCDGIFYLDSRSDFWRQQKPLYARKNAASKKGQGKKSPSEQARYIVKELEKVEEAQNAGRFEESLKRAKRCLKIIQSNPPSAIEDREEVLAQVYCTMGNAYMELGNLDEALTYFKKDLEIGEEHDIEESQSRGKDNVGRVFARQGNFQQAIACWESKLDTSKAPLERAWLNHEIGRCHLELGNYDNARMYGEKAVAAANEAGDEMWQLNATVLVAQSEVKMNSFDNAEQSFEKALEMAKRQGDSQAEIAVKKALDDVREKQRSPPEEGETHQTEDEESPASPKEEQPAAKSAPSPVAKEEPPPAKEEEPPAEKAATPEPEDNTKTETKEPERSSNKEEDGGNDEEVQEEEGLKG